MKKKLNKSQVAISNDKDNGHEETRQINDYNSKIY